jgi:hypothetical protein
VKSAITEASSAYCNLSNDQTIGGVKTFSVIPKITATILTNDNSTNIATTQFVKSAITEASSAYCNLSNDQTIEGVKTFSAIPKITATILTSDDSDNIATTRFVKSASLNASKLYGTIPASVDFTIPFENQKLILDVSGIVKPSYDNIYNAFDLVYHNNTSGNVHEIANYGGDDEQAEAVVGWITNYYAPYGIPEYKATILRVDTAQQDISNGVLSNNDLPKDILPEFMSFNGKNFYKAGGPINYFAAEIEFSNCKKDDRYLYRCFVKTINGFIGIKVVLYNSAGAANRTNFRLKVKYNGYLKKINIPFPPPP